MSKEDWKNNNFKQPQVKIQNDFLYMEQETFSSFDFFTFKTPCLHATKGVQKQKPRQNFKD